jgi:hypothetical protein
MSDPGYWLTTLALWHSPVWLKLKVPLIVIGVIGFLTAVIAFSRHEGRRDLQAAREYAQARGWEFSRTDTLGLEAEAERIMMDLWTIDLHFIRTVQAGRPSIHLFDCACRYRPDADRFSSRGVACLIRSDKFDAVGVQVDIVGRDWTEGMIADKVQMRTSPFAEKFLVLAKDAAAAREIVTTDVQAVMMDHLKKPLYNPVSVSLGPGGAVVMIDPTHEHEQLQDIIDLARRIEAVMP